MKDPVVRRMPAIQVDSYDPARLQRLRSISRALDSAVGIPGTGYRFGLDALIGLVPGVGDAVGAIFSGYIVIQAAKLGASRSVITRMIANVAVDTIVGEIPLLGDLFDVAWKANTKNLALLEEHLHRPSRAKAGSRVVVFLLGLGLFVLFAAAIALGVVVTRYVLNHL
jgi:Domain of unknown function (DUF4112)